MLHTRMRRSNENNIQNKNLLQRVNGNNKGKRMQKQLLTKDSIVENNLDEEPNNKTKESTSDNNRLMTGSRRRNKEDSEEGNDDNISKETNKVVVTNINNTENGTINDNSYNVQSSNGQKNKHVEGQTDDEIGVDGNDEDDQDGNIDEGDEEDDNDRDYSEQSSDEESCNSTSAFRLQKRGRPETENEEEVEQVQTPTKESHNTQNLLPPKKKTRIIGSPNSQKTQEQCLVRKYATDRVFRGVKFINTRQMLQHIMQKVSRHFQLDENERQSWEIAYEKEIRYSINNKRNSVSQDIKKTVLGEFIACFHSC